MQKIRRLRSALLVIALSMAAVGGLSAPAATAAVVVTPGMAIETTHFRCSVGMVAHIGNGNYAITAAHCFEAGARVRDHSGNEIGWYSNQLGNDSTQSQVGYALIRLWDNVGVSASLGRFGIRTIDTNPIKGEGLCKIGSTTGWTCGTITDVSDKVFWTTLTAADGDSGSVVYHQNADGSAAFMGILLGRTFGGTEEIESANYLNTAIKQHESSLLWWIS
ncbi:hypothetical protein AB0L82_35660 [Nocardia sp. NPDC052001]|uniref:hypothetical protein n=1 Tax=Nocardia sp. NPDC052001 TaxID=3154853 RepID=UPI00343AAD68